MILKVVTKPVFINEWESQFGTEEKTKQLVSKKVSIVWDSEFTIDVTVHALLE